MSKGSEKQFSEMDCSPEAGRMTLHTTTQSLLTSLSKVASLSELQRNIKGLAIVKAWAIQNAVELKRNVELESAWSAIELSLAGDYSADVIQLFKRSVWKALGITATIDKRVSNRIKTMERVKNDSRHRNKKHIQHNEKSRNDKFDFPAIFDDVRIERLNFKDRTKNILRCCCIFRLSQLRGMSKRYLAGRHGCGQQTIDDICIILQELSEAQQNNQHYELPANLRDEGDFIFPHIYDELGIDDIRLSVRAYHALTNIGVTKLAHFRSLK